MPDKSVPRGRSPKPPVPWVGFLEALDGLLDATVDLHCIGGFAITMQFGLSRETSDLDILGAVPSGALAELQKLAGEGSDLHQRCRVYLQPVAVATYPENYESRLIRMWPDFPLGHLRLFSLEPHDLALTKLERNIDVDRQDVLGLAAAGLINATTLRDRYETEFRPNVVSGAERFDLTLRLWSDMCWPSA